jgi:hypothetical protein
MGRSVVSRSTVTLATPVACVVLWCLAIAGILSLGSTDAMAQSVLASGPRTEWGAPDLRGVWGNRSVTPLQRPAELFDTEFYSAAELADLESGAVQRAVAAFPPDETALNGEFTDVWMEPGALSRRTSLIVGPNGSIPPLTPEAEAQRASGRNGFMSDLAESYEDRPWGERCLRHQTGGPPMLPLVFANLLHILQTPEQVAILHEENHEFRIIHLDGRPHIGSDIHLWRGNSRGRWEGDTLVVETTNFNGNGGFMGSGRGLRLTERFQRVDTDTILFGFTVSDPDTWTAPWSAEMPLVASPEPLYEFACHEGNYSLTNILNAARLAEARVGGR